MNRTTITKTLLGLTALATLGVPASGQAAECTEQARLHSECRYIVSGPGDTYKPTYTQPVAVADRNDVVTLVHADPTGLHDVVARRFGSDDASHCGEDVNPFKPGIQRRFPLGSCPVFWSELIGIGQTTLVRGTEQLVAGTVYEFYCSIHGNMIGRLVGAPV